MAFDNTIARAHRRQRRSAVRLIVVSSVFAVVGLLMVGFTGSIFGVFIAIFFAAGIVAGAMQLVGADTRTGRLLAIIGAFTFALACAMLIVLTLMGVVIDAPGRSRLGAGIAAVIGLVFFGGGGIVLILRFSKRGRKQ